jgi:hypothetical protein
MAENFSMIMHVNPQLRRLYFAADHLDGEGQHLADLMDALENEKRSTNLDSRGCTPETGEDKKKNV